MKYILVDEISTFLLRYVVEIPEDAPKSWALDTVTMGDDTLKEFSQTHVMGIPVSCREISKEDLLILFDEENPYTSGWTEEQKLRCINSI
jgi:hypothetical protein